MYYEDKLVNSVYVIGRCLLREFYGPCKSTLENWQLVILGTWYVNHHFALQGWVTSFVRGLN